MAKKEEESWLWLGVIAAAVTVIAYLAYRYLTESGGLNMLKGSYYAESSVDEFIGIMTNYCAGYALGPEMITQKAQAISDHMRGKHVKDMQDALDFAEKFQNTGNTYWKSEYDNKMKAICIHTLDNLQVPRKKTLSAAGGAGTTGNLIPTYSDVYVAPSTPGTTVQGAAGFVVRSV